MAPALHAPIKKTRRRFCDGNWHCADCGTSSTPVRRNSPLTGVRSVCNACGLRRSKALRAAKPITSAPTSVAASRAQEPRRGRPKASTSAPFYPPVLHLGPSAPAVDAAVALASSVNYSGSYGDYAYSSSQPCLSDWSDSACSAEGVSSLSSSLSPLSEPSSAFILRATAAASAIPPPLPAAQVCCPLDEMLWSAPEVADIGISDVETPTTTAAQANTVSLEKLLGEIEGDGGMLGAALDFRSFGGVTAVDAPFYV